MNQVLDILAQADSRLATISVSGSDVYTMVDVRRLMKAAYEIIRKEAEHGTDGTASCGNLDRT